MLINRPVPASAHVAPLLHSRMVVVLTGLSYLCVGLGFSYLDRHYGSFGREGVMWLVWAVLGFGAGALHSGRPAPAGHTQWAVLGGLGLLLCVFPGLLIFNMLRWVSLLLMVVVGARAAILKTRRDFYLALTVIFVVSFMVGTHGNADWTLWIYLGPAWVFGGLALAWEHAAGVPLSRWTKLSMTLGFMGVALLLTAVLFFFAPRPSNLGFGFLPPGTDTPGMFEQSAGQGEGTQRAGGGGPGGGDSAGTGASQGAGGAGVPQWGGLGEKWKAMLDYMRQTNADRSIPQWQRSLINTLLNAAQSAASIAWWWVLVVLVVAYWLWRLRHRLGLALTLGVAWLLASYFPAQSMRVSATAMKWCLQVQGHRRRPGQSVREHWGSAVHLAPLARRWLGYAVESYCASRFGGVPASAQRARDMHRAVQGACDIVLGYTPELSR